MPYLTVGNSQPITETQGFNFCIAELPDENCVSPSTWSTNVSSGLPHWYGSSAIQNHPSRTLRLESLGSPSSFSSNPCCHDEPPPEPSHAKPANLNGFPFRRHIR